MIQPGTTQVLLPARLAVRRLVEEGIVHGLDDAALDRLRAECWDDDEAQMEDVGLLGVLTLFYESCDRGIRDGFFWRDDQFWNQTEDVVAELAALLPEDRPLLRQRGISERLISAPRGKETVHVLELERYDGEIEELEARSLDDVVERFNDLLAARGSARRLIPLDTSSEWRMYIAMELDRARRLAVEGVLPVATMEPFDPPAGRS